MAITNYILDKINSPKDLRRIKETDLQAVCDEVRSLIIEVMSVNPGHLGASLGVVELTVAIHYIFNTPDDVLVWDVGHQSYAHKILTERKDTFNSIRHFDAISGFPSIQESRYDSFGTGHSSTSISAVLGMAVASDLDLQNSRQHIAVIGDGALTGGMAFEALNHASDLNANVLIIVNDNDMSIDDSVGGLRNHLNSIGSDTNIFTNLGIDYYEKINGNNLSEVLKALTIQKDKKGIRVLHIITKKGFGYKMSEDGNATLWHAPGKFDIETGALAHKSKSSTYQDVVSDSLCKLGETNENIIVVTPAMASGSKLLKFQVKFPNRFFDTGITEQHAVTFSAGLAKAGKIPFCVVYSTFLQRGYDQLIHDVALQNLPVIFLIDRAGIVGHDGATHHGAFDLAFLNCIPNMTILIPMNEQELENMILSIPSNIDGPVAIRYPRGNGAGKNSNTNKTSSWKLSDFHKIQLLKKGTYNAVISIGQIGNTVSKVVAHNATIAHYNLRCAKPFDTESLTEIFKTHHKIYITEDGVERGGIGSEIISWAVQNGFKNDIILKGYPDTFIPHGTPEELYQSIGMDAIGLTNLLID